MIGKDGFKQSWKTKLNASDATTPLEEPGSLRFTHDPISVSDAGVVTALGFGPCFFKYVRAVAALSAGDLVSYPALTAISNQTGTDTRSITTTGLTASDHIQKLAYVLDDAGGAEAAPEGEVARIVSNSTTLVTIDYETPYSVALAANDDVSMIGFGTYVEDAAAGDDSHEVAGVVVADQAAGDWGWVQCKGIVAQAGISGAITADVGLIAGTALVAVSSTSALDLIIGRGICAVTSGVSKAPIYIDVLSGISTSA